MWYIDEQNACSSPASPMEGSIALPTHALMQGASCLDGSPPVYYIRTGSGDGADKWILHLMGGAWCQNSTECYDRSFTMLGTSTLWTDPITMPNILTRMDGILSANATTNPDFYNWNAVFFVYCDGSSFAGDVYVS